MNPDAIVQNCPHKNLGMKKSQCKYCRSIRKSTKAQIASLQERYTYLRRAKLNGNFIENVDRRIVFKRDKGICHICSLSVDPDKFHLDHVVPVSKDGEHSYANIRLAHPHCNLVKSTKTVGQAITMTAKQRRIRLADEWINKNRRHPSAKAWKV